MDGSTWLWSDFPERQAFGMRTRKIKMGTGKNIASQMLLGLGMNRQILSTLMAMEGTTYYVRIQKLNR
jgi:hypothetical protein